MLDDFHARRQGAKHSSATSLQRDGLRLSVRQLAKKLECLAALGYVEMVVCQSDRKGKFRCTPLFETTYEG